MMFKQSSTDIVLGMRKRLESVASQNRLKEIANVSGVPYGTVCKISQGVTDNPRLDTVVKLSNALEKHWRTGRFA